MHAKFGQRRSLGRGCRVEVALVQKPATETLFCFPAIIALCSVSFYIVFFLPPALPLISARFSLRIIQAVTVLLAYVASVSVWFRSKERPSNDMEQDFQFWLHEEWNDSQKMKGRRWRGRKANPLALLLAPFFACCLTLVPLSQLRNRTETLARQATCLCIAECPAAVSNAFDGQF